MCVWVSLRRCCLPAYSLLRGTSLLRSRRLSPRLTATSRSGFLAHAVSVRVCARAGAARDASATPARPLSTSLLSLLRGRAMPGGAVLSRTPLGVCVLATVAVLRVVAPLLAPSPLHNPHRVTEKHLWRCVARLCRRESEGEGGGSALLMPTRSATPLPLGTLLYTVSLSCQDQNAFSLFFQPLPLPCVLRCPFLCRISFSLDRCAAAVWRCALMLLEERRVGGASCPCGVQRCSL